MADEASASPAAYRNDCPPSELKAGVDKLISCQLSTKKQFLPPNIGVNERKLLTLRQLTEIAKIIKPYNTKKLHYYYD